LAATESLEHSAVLPILLRWSYFVDRFDSHLALQNYEFDRAHGLHSLVVAGVPRIA